jgi:phosphatidate cytidylyltransferase
MVLKFTLVGSIIFGLGYLLCALLYRKQGKRLRGSRLEVKILLWIPLFLAAGAFTLAGFWIRLAIVLFVIAQLWREALAAKSLPALGGLHTLLVSLGVVAALGIIGLEPTLFLAVWLMSVLSDVVAFFAGNYFGRHALPAGFNKQKTWEGVAGQLLGALLGFGLIHSFVMSPPLYLAPAIGIGSAAGDLANSYIKRRLGIKEWSNRLPGHGGYLDRFSSLAFALLVSYGLLLVWPL